MKLDYPWQFDGRGRTREADHAAYVRGLIEQVLFTAPGERVNRPDFGSGLAQLTFEPNHAELAATTQALAQGALQQWLGHLITVESVAVESREARLQVTVIYRLNRDGTRQQASFSQGGFTEE